MNFVMLDRLIDASLIETGGVMTLFDDRIEVDDDLLCTVFLAGTINEPITKPIDKEYLRCICKVKR